MNWVNKIYVSIDGKKDFYPYKFYSYPEIVTWSALIAC